jgi:hypothetical protein
MSTAHFKEFNRGAFFFRENDRVNVVALTCVHAEQ